MSGDGRQARSVAEKVLQKTFPDLFERLQRVFAGVQNFGQIAKGRHDIRFRVREITFGAELDG